MCHIPLSYVFNVVVGCIMDVVNPEEDGGADPTGRGAPTGGISVPIGAIDWGSRAECTTGEVVIVDEISLMEVESIGMLGVTVTEDGSGFAVDIEVEADVGGAIEVVWATVTEAVEICVLKMIAVTDDGVSPTLTTVYTGFADVVADGEEDGTVFVKSRVTLTWTVFAGSSSLTTAVDMSVSVDAGSVTAGAVTV